LSELQESLKLIADERLTAINDLQETQVVRLTYLQHEEKRIEKKLGKDHVRTGQLKARVENHFGILKNLRVESEIARIKIPEISEDDTLVHGRLIDENHWGIGGLFVYMTDERGKPIASLGRSETDVSGYYFLVIDPKTFKKMANVIEAGVFLSVGTKRGKIIHREFESVKMTEGDRILVEILLNRDDFTKVREPGVRPSEKVGAKEDKGARLEDINGIGEKRAEKLRKVGIADIEDFLEADEKKLKEILGNVDISRMKEEGADILKSKRNASGEKKEE
jgi:hypothetical protein